MLHQSSAAATQGHALSGFHSVRVLDIVSAVPARSSVAKASHDAPRNHLAQEWCNMQYVQLMLRWLLHGGLLLTVTAAAQAGEPACAANDCVSLAALAASADTVVLAQARDTDYVYRRGFPVEGSAYLMC